MKSSRELITWQMILNVFWHSTSVELIIHESNAYDTINGLKM